jgi:hypothetical protein
LPKGDARVRTYPPTGSAAGRGQKSADESSAAAVETEPNAQRRGPA